MMKIMANQPTKRRRKLCTFQSTKNMVSTSDKHWQRMFEFTNSLVILSSAIPIPHPVPVPVHQEIRVPIPQPYNVNVNIPQPYPVEVIKHVEIPVEKPEPYTVEKHVSSHATYHVEWIGVYSLILQFWQNYHKLQVPFVVEKPYPVYVEKRFPVPIAKPYAVHVPVYKHVFHHTSGGHGKGWH